MVRGRRPVRLGAALVALVLLVAGCATPREEQPATAPGDDESTEVESLGEDDGGAPDRRTAAAPAAAPAVAPGFDGLRVAVGLIGPLPRQLVAGQRAYWRYVNDRLGGVGARFPVELHSVDHEDDRGERRGALVEDVVVVASVGDGPLVDGVLERLGREGAIASPASRAARWTAQPFLLPIGIPEPQQLEEAERWLAEQGREPAPACIVAAGSDGPASLVEEVTATGCRDVVLRGRPTEVEAVLGAAAAAAAPVRWVVLADGWSAALAGGGRTAAYAEEQVAVVLEETCAPTCAGDRGASGDDLADPWFRYGWAQARVVHQVLEEAVEAGGLDRATVADAAASLPPVDLDGVLPPWTYGGPDGRRPPTALTVVRYHPTDDMWS